MALPNDKPRWMGESLDIESFSVAIVKTINGRYRAIARDSRDFCSVVEADTPFTLSHSLGIMICQRAFQEEFPKLKQITDEYGTRAVLDEGG